MKKAALTACAAMVVSAAATATAATAARRQKCSLFVYPKGRFDDLRCAPVAVKPLIQNKTSPGEQGKYAKVYKSKHFFERSR